jgi:galactokinase
MLWPMTDIRASASGRVNLIGEHTDYNEGRVLPTAIPQRTDVVLRRRDDDEVHAVSASEGAAAAYRIGEEERTGGWVDYVAGVTWALARHGHALPGGFDLEVSSHVPLGAGLSSSAALEVAVGRAVREAFGLEVTDEELAAIGREAENGLVGVQTGPMDQLAAALTTPGEALLIDCRTLETTTVVLPEDCELVVIDSGVRHALSDGSYDERRAECARAVELLGVPALRDVALGDPRLAGLPAPLDRRARHVVEEDARVLEAVAAIEGDDLAQLGRLLDASHASQRDLYEVSVPQVDRLAELAVQHGALGARLTGGGFGGSVLALARTGDGADLGARVLRDYTAEHPDLTDARVLVPPDGGS